MTEQHSDDERSLPAPVPAAAHPVPDGAVADPVDAVPAAPAAGASRRPAWLLPTATGVAGFLLGVLVVGGAVLVSNMRADSAEDAAIDARAAILPDALEGCDATGADGFALGDGGLSLTFDMKGEDESTGGAYLDIACVFLALDMPSAVTSHIDQTTSMDGRQTETWDGITVSWSYHPDRGLDGVLTVDDETAR